MKQKQTFNTADEAYENRGMDDAILRIDKQYVVCPVSELTEIPKSWRKFINHTRPANFIVNIDGMYQYTTSTPQEVKKTALAGVNDRIHLDFNSGRYDYRELIFCHISAWIDGGGSLDEMLDWAVEIYQDVLSRDYLPEC